MKKIIFFAIAIATMVSCAKEEILDYDKGNAISFGKTFIDNATRAIDPSHTTGDLESFNVYGIVNTLDNNKPYINIFNGVEVTKEEKANTDITGEDAWFYDASYVQYWIDGRNYTFVAVVDGGTVGTDTNGMPTTLTISNVANTQPDVLYSNVVEINDTDSERVDAIDFTFSHLMSKVKFVANVATIPASYSYKVTGITINDAADGGVYTISTSTWDTTDGGEKDYSFGNITTTDAAGAAATALAGGSSTESNWERLLVPQTITSVSFTVKLFNNGVETDSDDITINTLDATLEVGHAYNFIINLDVPGTPITFGLDKVTGWDDNNGAGNNVTVQ